MWFDVCCGSRSMEALVFCLHSKPVMQRTVKLCCFFPAVGEELAGLKR